MKEKLIFHDKENNLIDLDIEIKEDKTFTMSGNMGGSCGQIQDNIKPLNKEQKELLEIWEKWHLNDMKAGTEKQEQALKEWRLKNKINGYAYDQEVEFLKSINLYEDKGYKYGSAWLKKELPKDFEKNLKQLIETIRQQEQKRKESFKDSDLTFEDIEDEKIIALAQHLELSPQEAKEDITQPSKYNENFYSYCGIDYFIGNEDETRQEAIDYLTDDTYLYQSWVEQQIKEGNASFIKNIDDWAEWVIDMDGYGSILNSYDGTEYSETVNGTDYYIIRK